MLTGGEIKDGFSKMVLLRCNLWVSMWPLLFAEHQSGSWFHSCLFLCAEEGKGEPQDLLIGTVLELVKQMQLGFVTQEGRKPVCTSHPAGGPHKLWGSVGCPLSVLLLGPSMGPGAAEVGCLPGGKHLLPLHCCFLQCF